MNPLYIYASSHVKFSDTGLGTEGKTKGKDWEVRLGCAEDDAPQIDES